MIELKKQSTIVSKQGKNPALQYVESIRRNSSNMSINKFKNYGLFNQVNPNEQLQ